MLAEADLGERRVALVPEMVTRLVDAGHRVVVQWGAGAGAHLPDGEFVAAGAEVVSSSDVLAAADVLLAVNRPPAAVLAALREGTVLLGLLGARGDRTELDALARRGVHVLSLDLLPRTLSRAQTMDALTSQASIAGYRAAIVAAEAYQRYFPMMITAAGTARPAKVLVLGAGVAGLQAIGTARRLGAQVFGYDVRPAAREEVTSLGAQFLSTPLDAELAAAQAEASAAGAAEGGYARALTPEESARQQAELAEQVAGFDAVITTAQVPGGRPPVLVTAATVAAMRRGSVVVDLASGPSGGNVEGSVAGERTLTESGVTLIGAPNLPGDMAAASSAAYARNVVAVLGAVVSDGALALDPDDEVVGALLVTVDGATDDIADETADDSMEVNA
ncbi:NAD(P) transhydrogenase subunit alpha [Sanguibacter suaedae]|uniref:proton-translocating NAD(P)(+) transhydrogenase n=1 Tax=Sanguibacter suaedae TaxID=2795737 RepID=A0A934I7P5_9MICO|nr:NAD(P) transhydrogenase subunit alpha [Sanguibacter suaedae]MBI9114677.1 NAD(P) transhydrogenase subunit alpha [Sanguibacter suaedae]